MAIPLTEALQKIGFSITIAKQWSNFIASILEVLSDAEQKLKEPENWRLFTQKKGSLRKRQEKSRKGLVSRIPHEAGLTTELKIHVKDVLNALPLEHFLRRNEIHFAIEDPVESQSRAGHYSKRADLRFESLYGKRGLEFAIEAKTIVSQPDLAIYLGDDGLGCFLADESPYTLAPFGGMVAYTISERQRSWAPEIWQLLNDSSPSPLSIVNVTVSGRRPEAIFSRHKRSTDGSRPISILHFEMFFDRVVENNG